MSARRYAACQLDARELPQRYLFCFQDGAPGKTRLMMPGYIARRGWKTASTVAESEYPRRPEISGDTIEPSINRAAVNERVSQTAQRLQRDGMAGLSAYCALARQT